MLLVVQNLPVWMILLMVMQQHGNSKKPSNQGAGESYVAFQNWFVNLAVVLTNMIALSFLLLMLMATVAM